MIQFGTNLNIHYTTSKQITSEADSNGNRMYKHKEIH
jgi:hypothetical protein